MHVAGAMTTDGQEGQIDLRLQGDDAIGSVTLAGSEIALIRWTARSTCRRHGLLGLARAPRRLGAVRRPLGDPARGRGGGFAEFSLTGFADALRNPDDGEIQDEVARHDDVVVVRQENGSTLTVADEDPSYPLEMTNTGDSTGTVTFDQFGETAEITAPANPLDLSALAGG